MLDRHRRRRARRPRGGVHRPDAEHIRALVDELGIATFPSLNPGKNVYFAGGRRTLYADTGPTGTAPPDVALLADLLLAVPKLNSLSLKVPVDAPWDAPRRGAADSESLETWLRRNSPAASASWTSRAPRRRPIFGAEPRELSLLFVLFFIAASGDERTRARSSATSTRATARSRSASTAARSRSPRGSRRGSAAG